MIYKTLYRKLRTK